MTATPTPPPLEPAVTTPSVPYGPGASAPASGTPAGFTLDLSKRSVGSTAAKWGIRILLPILIRAIFRAIARR